MYVCRQFKRPGTFTWAVFHEEDVVDVPEGNIVTDEAKPIVTGLSFKQAKETINAKRKREKGEGQ